MNPIYHLINYIALDKNRWLGMFLYKSPNRPIWNYKLRTQAKLSFDWNENHI